MPCTPCMVKKINHEPYKALKTYRKHCRMKLTFKTTIKNKLRHLYALYTLYG